MDAVDILKKKNLKKSIQRIAIIDALQKRMRPLTEEEIKEEMGELYDRITFYRTMQTLVGAGIVHRVVVDKTMVEYAINNKGEECHHAHFYCKVCHTVTCLEDVPAYHYDLPDAYKVEECEVVIKGICPNCRKNPAASVNNADKNS